VCVLARHPLPTRRSSDLVPLMCVVYVLAALAVLIVNFSEIPAAFSLIFAHAFTPAAATGGFAGAAVMVAIQYGVARGIFSNEARSEEHTSELQSRENLVC